MYDLHCHITPAIDDGSQSLRETRDMLRIAADSGIHTIVATPHGNIPGETNYTMPMLQEQFGLLGQAAEQAHIRVLHGMEVFAYGTRIVGRLRAGELLTLADTRSVLVEFPFFDRPSHVIETVLDLLRADFRPIIAHPERYRFIQRELELLDELLDLGCALQVNKGSPLGRFGAAPQQVSLHMIERGMVHLIASDAHSSEQRTPYLLDCAEFLDKTFGEGCSALLMHINPRHILHDEELESFYEP